MTPSIVNSRPSIVKKASKISFTLKRDKGKEKDHSIDGNKDRETAGRPSGATTLTATASSGSSSFINVPSNHTVVSSQETQTQTNGPSVPTSPIDVDPTSPRSASPATAAALAVAASNKTKVLPPIPRDFANPRSASPLPAHRSPSLLPTGEVDRDVFESMGNNSLSVRFEINIVKVLHVSLHGKWPSLIC